MKKYTRIEKDSQIKLPGYSVVVESHNSSIKSITITAPGSELKIVGDYGLSVLIPEPPKMVKIHRISGTTNDFPIVAHYKDEYSAKDGFAKLDDNDKRKRETIEVPEDDLEKYFPSGNE